MQELRFQKFLILLVLYPSKMQCNIPSKNSNARDDDEQTFTYRLPKLEII